MSSNQQHEPLAASVADCEAAPAASMHPRILVRMNLVAVTRARDKLVAELDKLIGTLDCMSRFDDWFSIQSVTTRELRDQLAFADIQSPDTLVLMAQITQILAGIIPKLIASNPR